MQKPLGRLCYPGVDAGYVAAAVEDAPDRKTAAGVHFPHVKGMRKSIELLIAVDKVGEVPVSEQSHY